MIDPFIIDILKKKEERDKRRKEDGERLPLYINPPEYDGYSEKPDSGNKGKRGYIEIDLNEDCGNIFNV